MKKFLSLILAAVMLFCTLVSLASCAEPAIIENLTVKEAYDAAVSTVEKMTGFDLEISGIYNTEYNGETMSSTEVKTVYKSNGSSYYFDEVTKDLSADAPTSNTPTANKYWYINGEMYSIYNGFNEKITMSKTAFEERYMVSKDGLIFKIDESAFQNVNFEKIDGKYVANVAVTPENYYNYTGVQITGNANCKMVFDANANILSFCISAGYDRGSGIIIYLDREIKFNSIGKEVVITPPANASEFRVAPSMDSLDMTALATKDNLVETEEKTNLVKMTTNYGDIIIRLYPNVAPITVENFKNLVSKKFYDGLTFHRIIENMLIQGGDPKGNGTGGSDKNIAGEFEYNGFTNNLLHKRGVISMARSELYDSASSQFFIVHTDNLYWDGQYATFGYVVYGMDVVDTITALETDENDKPIAEAKIISVRFVK